MRVAESEVFISFPLSHLMSKEGSFLRMLLLQYLFILTIFFGFFTGPHLDLLCLRLSAVSFQGRAIMVK